MLNGAANVTVRKHRCTQQLAKSVHLSIVFRESLRSHPSKEVI
ncbi:hypothetical protein SynWH8103_01585 [Synechococcus sp. WH 8103]|nr:hypothetical protein SynA18461_01616 [Synechococcus sp. A18-46.1]CRY92312.1 hypothetical protein SynWH8103_01585 [Synechococcus sp. WH 8103]